MIDHDFQRELLRRIGHLEAEIRGLKAEFAGFKSQLSERCESRRESGLEVRQKQAALQDRLEALELLEHRKRGGIIVLSSLLALAGALGGLVVKWLETAK